MEDIATSVWIDPSWLSWRRYVEGGHYLFDGAPARPHEIHQHACDRLASDPNSFDRTDAIMHLRRAVGQRVQMLMKNYQLRRVQISTKPERDLELLSYFGIIRPFMLRQLIKIRNLVEHEDSIPPSTDECLMFADLVWYFLRSTDALVNLRSEEIEFVGPGGDIYDDYTPSVNLSFKEPSMNRHRFWLG